MRIWASAVVALVAFASTGEKYNFVVSAKKPTRSGRVTSSRGRPSSTGNNRKSSSSSRRGSGPVSRRRVVYDDEEDEEDEDELGFPDDDEENSDEDDDDEEEEDEEDFEEEEESRRVPSKSRRSTSSKSSSRSRGVREGPPTSSRRRPSSSSSSKPTPRKRPGDSRPRYDDDYEEEDYEYGRPSARGRRPPPSSQRRRPPPGRGRNGRPTGRVVPYTTQPAGAFAGFLSGVRESIPDPSSIRAAAETTLSAAKETTTKLSNTVYREVKGLTSSELEQVMLKATRPDDSPVKGKHVERLVGVTYQISGRYDIYDSVLRKLWSKMAEKDWRTTVKALYVLHRFSADGAPDHAPALKARLRELRRTKDPKRKDKYFNSKQLLAGDTTPENMKFRAFMSRYAHYVILRAQCFGGMFDEISSDPSPSGGKSTKSKKKLQKPITSTALRPEHLDAAKLLLKAGTECSLRSGEECENTAIAVERVASDLIGLTAAVAIAINRALKGDDLKGADPALIKKWCEFYSEELLPKTKSMVKKTSTKLDAYGLFLPSRMGTSVSQDVLQKGLNAVEEEKEETTEEEQEESPEAEVEEAEASTEETVGDKIEKDEDANDEEDNESGEIEEKEEEENEQEDDDVYEYEDEEYYDEEE